MKNIILLVFTAIMLFSCSSTLKVTTNVDPTANFSAFKTLEFYGWTKLSDEGLLAFYKKNIEKSFQTEFLNRGIKTVNKGDGDIIVSLYIVIDKKIEKVATTSSTNIGNLSPFIGFYGYGGYYGYGPEYGWGGGYPNSITTVVDHEYETGTLIVSVYDARKKELIWEAVGSKPLSQNLMDAEESKNKIQEIVADIMKKYPVKPQK